jgi:hypothetical protein
MTDNEVTELIEELDRLQIQITRVNERLRQLENKTHIKEKTNPINTSDTLRVGDIVEVTNRYKGRLGVRGTIVRVTSAQVVIRESDNGETFRKYKANVKRVR